MKQAIRSSISITRLPWGVLLLLCLVYLAFPASLSACAMSALIATDGHLLADFPSQGLPRSYYYYNDPWDYFGFVMANSHPYSNSDGYGVVAYPAISSRLQADDMWFKRVLQPLDFGNLYYTGDYLRGSLNSTYPRYDVMDRAMQSIRDPANSAAIVLAHVRSASGVTMGNHPFWFHRGRRSYSFMHNGNASSARNFMISEISSMNSEMAWFNIHPSNYFNDPNPLNWVDSEVLFHYVISHIINSGNDTTLGILNAMRGIRQFLNNASYNFIMSDGDKLYAFRSSASSSYQLSYKQGPGWIGIRTQSPYPDETKLRPQELVILSRSAEPRHILLLDYIDGIETQPVSPNRVSLSPNPASSGGIITLTPVYPLGSGKNAALVEIFNMKGQLLRSNEIPDLSSGMPVNLELGAMTSGIYFCRIRSGGYFTTIRFSVVK
ncbi:MAG: T9SS type A sorting domain-containing protein [Candidatus Cloacimonetes bacterium]|nr:T9SS type A sorting domain-containing protein [Candidatus Cloacimonadota bacterium]